VASKPSLVATALVLGAALAIATAGGAEGPKLGAGAAHWLRTTATPGTWVPTREPERAVAEGHEGMTFSRSTTTFERRPCWP